MLERPFATLKLYRTYSKNIIIQGWSLLRPDWKTGVNFGWVTSTEMLKKMAG